MAEQFDVKMGEFRLEEGEKVLIARGVGSCVAVCLYSKEKSIGAMVHGMLPEEDGENSSKHIDVLLENVFEEFENRDLDFSKIKSKVFGGAKMFSNSLDIGERNIESAKKILNEKEIDIEAEDVGGEKGRIVWLNCRSGEATVKKTFEETKRY